MNPGFWQQLNRHRLVVCGTEKIDIHPKAASSNSGCNFYWIVFHEKKLPKPITNKQKRKKQTTKLYRKLLLLSIESVRGNGNCQRWKKKLFLLFSLFMKAWYFSERPYSGIQCTFCKKYNNGKKPFLTLSLEIKDCCTNYVFLNTVWEKVNCRYRWRKTEDRR